MIKYLIIVAVSALCVCGQFSGCDYAQNLNPWQTYDIFSPNYGSNLPYQSGVNCRWRAVAPANYQIKLNCSDMRLPQNNCADRIDISWTGIYDDPNPTYACAGQTFVRITGNQIVIALRSQPTGTATGRFRCQIIAQTSVFGTPIGTPIGTPVAPIIGTNIGK